MLFDLYNGKVVNKRSRVSRAKRSWAKNNQNI